MKPALLCAIAAALLGGVAIRHAQAHTWADVEQTCPLCNTKFKARVDMSGTQFGMRLDLKPLGPIAAPWSVPVCPKCHFVLFDDEIAEDVLQRCRKIVAAEQYKAQAKRASYHLLGLLYEGLQKEPLALAHTFLKASWQEESDAEQLKDDLQRSLKHFEAYLERAKQHDDAWQTAQVVKAELFRRLGRFDEAKKHVDALLEMKEFRGTFLEDLLRYQLKLISKKDTAPHAASEMNTASQHGSSALN